MNFMQNFNFGKISFWTAFAFWFLILVQIFFGSFIPSEFWGQSSAELLIILFVILTLICLILLIFGIIGVFQPHSKILAILGIILSLPLVGWGVLTVFFLWLIWTAPPFNPRLH
jgi:hypothetical protein